MARRPFCMTYYPLQKTVQYMYVVKTVFYCTFHVQIVKPGIFDRLFERNHFKFRYCWGKGESMRRGGACAFFFFFFVTLVGTHMLVVGRCAEHTFEVV